MKYNFKGYFNLGVIFLLIVLLLGVLGKTIFTEQNISYNKTKVYEEIATMKNQAQKGLTIILKQK